MKFLKFLGEKLAKMLDKKLAEHNAKQGRIRRDHELFLLLRTCTKLCLLTVHT